MNDIIDAMKDISMPRFDRFHAKRGPSKWLEIHDDRNQYGKDYDFKILDGNCFMPCSPAAQHWIWYVLPEDIDAVTGLDGYVGYVIEHGLEVLLDAADRDGLLSEDEYTKAMNEADEIARQWHD
jgi:hypothetical protein